jgi:hypothetical protein
VSQLAVVVELEKRVALLSVVTGERVGYNLIFCTGDSGWCGSPVQYDVKFMNGKW